MIVRDVLIVVSKEVGSELGPQNTGSASLRRQELSSEGVQREDCLAVHLIWDAPTRICRDGGEGSPGTY